MTLAYIFNAIQPWLAKNAKIWQILFLEHLQFWVDCLHIGHKWSLVWEGVLRIMTFELDQCFQGQAAMNLQKKLLKYGTSFLVGCTACAVLDGLFQYWAQMMTGMRQCVMRIGLWPWHISFRSVCYDIAIKLLKYGTSSHVTAFFRSSPVDLDINTGMGSVMQYLFIWYWWHSKGKNKNNFVSLMLSLSKANHICTPSWIQQWVIMM